MDWEYWDKMYRLTLKNKRRSKDSVLFEMHYEYKLYCLYNDIFNHTFESSAYTFMVPYPQPREVFACIMEQRILDHTIANKMNDIIEENLTKKTFNNRIGYGGIAAVNQLATDIYEMSNGFKEDAWIIKLDLKGYFPNALQDVVFKQLSDLLENNYYGNDKDMLRYILMRSIYTYPTDHCVRKSPLIDWEDYPREKSLFTKPDGVGGIIGRLLWQIAMTLYLNDIDQFFVNQVNNNELRYVRFVDDMCFVVKDKAYGLSLIPHLRSMLSEKGCALHPKKFYCQHYSKGVKFLGTTIKMDRMYVNNRVVRNAKKKLMEFNRKVRVGDIESFISSMNSYLGIMKSHRAHNIITELIEMVNPKWWKYCHFNSKRVCIQANRGYTHIELLCRKYGFTANQLKINKKKKNGNKRKNRKPGSGKTCSKSSNGIQRWTGFKMCKIGDKLSGNLSR